jgi:hypothetical protein
VFTCAQAKITSAGPQMPPKCLTEFRQLSHFLPRTFELVFWLTVIARYGRVLACPGLCQKGQLAAAGLRHASRFDGAIAFVWYSVVRHCCQVQRMSKHGADLSILSRQCCCCFAFVPSLLHAHSHGRWDTWMASTARLKITQLCSDARPSGSSSACRYWQCILAELGRQDVLSVRCMDKQPHDIV